MHRLAESHMYLMSLLVWLGFYLIGFIVFFKNRKTILIGSLAAIPQAFYALDIVQKAWTPDRVFQMKMGIEDFIFCFIVGGLVWMSSLWYARKFLSKILNMDVLKKNLLICYLFGIIASLTLFYLKIDGYLNPFIVMILWITFLLIIRKHYWKIAAWSSFIFLLIWFLIMSIIIKIWPDIPSLWTWGQFSGKEFMGYPIEELIWAVLYSVSWSMTIAYILNIQIKPSQKPDLIPSVKP